MSRSPIPPMPAAERTFAVPCSCSAVVAVTAGQAGTRVACPSCRGMVDVPRLRDLLALGHRAEPVSGRQSGWDAARGIAFAGVAITLLAALTASVAVPLGGLFVATPPRPDEVRGAVAALPISMVHAAWTELAQSGLNRMPSPLEQRYAKFTTATRSLSRVLWGIAAAAAAVAAAGFAWRSSRGRREVVS